MSQVHYLAFGSSGGHRAIEIAHFARLRVHSVVSSNAILCRAQSTWGRGWSMSQGRLGRHGNPSRSTNAFVEQSKLARRRLQTLWTSTGCEAWWSIYGALVARICVNILAVIAITLGDAVPLSNLDLRAVSAQEMASIDTFQRIGIGSAIPKQVTPFMLTVMPFVQAQIFVSIFVNIFPDLKKRFEDAEGQQKLHYWTNALAVFVAAGEAWAAAMDLHSLMPLGCGGGWKLSVAMALMAGSSIHWVISNMVQHWGLGNGVGFIYLMTISKGIVEKASQLPQQVWTSVTQLEGAQILVIAAIHVMACIMLNTARLNLKLSPLNVANHGKHRAAAQEPTDEDAHDVLPILLVPHVMLVLIGFHLFLAFFAPFFQMLGPIWGRVVGALILTLSNLVEAWPASSEMQTFISQVDLGIAGVAPGAATQEYLLHKILALRIAGGVLLSFLVYSAEFWGAWVTRLLQVPSNYVSLTDLLVVTSSVTTSVRLVERALSGSRYMAQLKKKASLFEGASNNFVRPTAGGSI